MYYRNGPFPLVLKNNFVNPLFKILGESGIGSGREGGN